MLVGGVVDDQVDDHTQPAVGGRAHELNEVPERAQPLVDSVVVRDVVAVVAVGRRVEGHQPQARHPQAGQIVDLADQATRGRRCRRRRSPERSRRRGSRRPRSSTTDRWSDRGACAAPGYPGSFLVDSAMAMAAAAAPPRSTRRCLVAFSCQQRDFASATKGPSAPRSSATGSNR